MVPSPVRPPAARRRGFSLIELMIAVAVVAVLASVAFPSYQAQMRKARRSDAQGFAMEVLQRQQQYLLDRRAYASSVTAAGADGGLGLAVPASVSPFYTPAMVASNVAPPTFTLTLTPTSRQSADSCGTLSLDQAGAKTASGGGSCW